MAQENKPTVYQSVMNTLGLGEKPHDQTTTPGVGTTTPGVGTQSTGLDNQTQDFGNQTQGLGNQTSDYSTDYSTQNTSTPGFSQSAPLGSASSAPVTTGNLESDNTGGSAFGSNDIYAQGGNRLGEPAQPLGDVGQDASAPYASTDDEPEELKHPEGGYSTGGIGASDDGTGVPHKESAKDKIKHVADKVKEKIGMGHK